MIHFTCNIGSQDLPDMYSLSPRAYISGKSLLPMLQHTLVPCVLKLNFLDHRHVLVPLAAAVTTKYPENVAIISSNNNLLYSFCTSCYALSCHLFYIP